MCCDTSCRLDIDDDQLDGECRNVYFSLKISMWSWISFLCNEKNKFVKMIHLKCDHCNYSHEIILYGIILYDTAQDTRINPKSRNTLRPRRNQSILKQMIIFAFDGTRYFSLWVTFCSDQLNSYIDYQRSIETKISSSNKFTKKKWDPTKFCSLKWKRSPWEYFNW